MAVTGGTVLLSDKKMNMRQQEHTMQVMAVYWFRYQYPECLLLAVPNGGQRNKIVAAKMKAEGVLAGTPDIFIPEPRNGFHGLWIEFKFGKNKLTDSQSYVIGKLRKNGYRCEVCYSLEEFLTIVDNYLKI